MAQMIKIDTIQFDDDIYPRKRIDDHNVNELVRAFSSGSVVPAIVVDKKTKICVDGKHRIAAAEKLEIDKLPADINVYKDKAAMLEAAIALNIHGRVLSAYDKAYCTILAAQVGLNDTRLQAALCTTTDYLLELKSRKVGTDHAGKPMPLKTTMRHMAVANTNKRFTKAQEAGHVKATGFAQIMYVNQVLNMLKHKMIDKNNAKLMEALEKLRDELIAFV